MTAVTRQDPQRSRSSQPRLSRPKRTPPVPAAPACSKCRQFLQLHGRGPSCLYLHLLVTAHNPSGRRLQLPTHTSLAIRWPSHASNLHEKHRPSIPASPQTHHMPCTRRDALRGCHPSMGARRPLRMHRTTPFSSRGRMHTPSLAACTRPLWPRGPCLMAGERHALAFLSVTPCARSMQNHAGLEAVSRGVPLSW